MARNAEPKIQSCIFSVQKLCKQVLWLKKSSFYFYSLKKAKLKIGIKLVMSFVGNILSNQSLSFERG